MTTCNVVIIGSGIAGLSAADALLKKGITDFQILEAQGRYGGRAYSIPYGNDVIEMGCQWLHGRNPLYDLCKSIGIVDEKTKQTGDLFYKTQDGVSLNDDYVEKILDEIDDLIDNLSDEIEDLSRDQSLMSLIDKKFNTYLGKKLSKKSLNNDQVELLRAIYGARLKVEKIDTACDRLDDLSAMGWNEYEDSKGDDMYIKGGYISLINYYLSRVTQSRIQLNQEVLGIDYSLANSNKVRIFTQNRLTGQRGFYEADQVLVTMSLGYLKAKHVEIFNPPLPADKSLAISRLGFGIVNKLFLVFNEQFSKDIEGVQIIWRRDIGMPPLNSLRKWNIDTSRFYESVESFEVHPKFRNILYSFITGSDAIFIESLPDQCLLEVLYELLNRFFPKVIRNPPQSIIRSRWNNDQFTKGSYTYVSMGSSVKDIRKLGDPINSRVFFAGEATSPEYYSSAHGAQQSGIKAANAIAKSISN